jgi:hypothetical protein
VDPGVGGERRILAAEVEGQVLMAPDNGLLSPVLAEARPARIISVTNAEYFHHPVSMTFHGRDVFAPVAAHLTLGVPLTALGREVSDLVQLEEGAAQVGPDAIEGRVIHVDHFGNLVTNISRRDLQAFAPGGEADLWVEIGDAEIAGVRRTYVEVGLGQLLALIGSSGLLEISANRRSAADTLGAGRRTIVRVSKR